MYKFNYLFNYLFNLINFLCCISYNYNIFFWRLVRVLLESIRHCFPSAQWGHCYLLEGCGHSIALCSSMSFLTEGQSEASMQCAYTSIGTYLSANDSFQGSCVTIDVASIEQDCNIALESYITPTYIPIFSVKRCVWEEVRCVYTLILSTSGRIHSWQRHRRILWREHSYIFQPNE